MSDSSIPVPVPTEAIKGFCSKWQIVEMAVFGSVARGDAGPESDLDLLVTFSEGAPWSLLDHARMQQELEEISGRSVDLVSRRGLERSANWIRRQNILESSKVIFREGEVPVGAR